MIRPLLFDLWQVWELLLLFSYLSKLGDKSHCSYSYDETFLARRLLNHALVAHFKVLGKRQQIALLVMPLMGSCPS